MSNFIHFGCWNNLNKGCLNNVMKLLNDRLNDRLKVDDKPTIDFLTIAGDNYYPKKQKVEGKKKKIIKPLLLEEGFAYLPTDIPIYMILGNHDLETNINIGEDNFFIDNLDNAVKTNVCSIIDYEHQSTNKNQKIEYNLFKEIMLENKTLIIMIFRQLLKIVLKRLKIKIILLMKIIIICS